YTLSLHDALPISAQDAREHVGLAVQDVGVAVATLRDQPDVLGDVGVGRTRPLAVDDLVVVLRVGDVGGLHGHPFREGDTGARCGGRADTRVNTWMNGRRGRVWQGRGTAARASRSTVALPPEPPELALYMRS